jgi:hypothetical protein
MNLFQHKVPMLALLNKCGRAGYFGWRASQVFALRVKKVDSLPRHDCDVPLLQVADHVGKWRKSDRVGPKVHFASAISDRKRRSFACSNYQIFVTFKQKRECKRTFQSRQCSAYRVDRLAPPLQLLIYQMSDHLSVCVRGKLRAIQSELVTQFTMIFDDPVVNDRNSINRVRVRVLFVCTPVSCPSRVADAYAADERLAGKLAFKVFELTDCSPPRKETTFKRGDTG